MRLRLALISRVRSSTLFYWWNVGKKRVGKEKDSKKKKKAKRKIGK